MKKLFQQIPAFVFEWTTTALVLIAVSGVLYTAGAIVYTLRRPDPLPRVFGYHELFHVLTVLAVAAQYVVVAFFVLPTD